MIRIALGCLLAIQLIPLRGQTPSINAVPPADALALKAPLNLAGCTVDRFAVHSPSMDRDIKVAVVLPPGYTDNPTRQYPILYALHGAGAAYDCFAAMPTLLAGLKDKPMIVAMFDGDTGSWYLDSPLPQTWSRDKKDTSTVKALFTTFFFDEYVPALDKKYRVNPEQRMLTGFSMGGFGAFHFMLAHPEMFCSVSGMSASYNNLAKMDDKTLDAGWSRFYGPAAQQRAEYAAIDPFEQIKADAAKGVKLPPIRIRCGSEDKHTVVDRKMFDLLTSLGYKCDYVESPGGHNWAYWKATMPEILDFHWRSLRQQ